MAGRKKKLLFLRRRGFDVIRWGGAFYARTRLLSRFSHVSCLSSGREKAQAWRPVSCRGRSVGRYNRPCPSRKQSKPNPPKCPCHRHSPQSPVLTFAGERGAPPPRYPCFPTTRQFPAFCRGPLCRAALIVPAPREASGGVSRSLLLGSELKPSKPVSVSFR